MSKARHAGRAMWRFVPALLLAVLAGPVLTTVIRPDPLWIGGVYDGGDADDLIHTATRADGVAPPVLAVRVPRRVAVATLCLPEVSGRPASGELTAPSRAPPAA